MAKLAITSFGGASCPSYAPSSHSYLCAQRQNQACIKKVAPERYHDKLIPTYRAYSVIATRRVITQLQARDSNASFATTTFSSPCIGRTSDGIDSIVKDCLVIIQSPSQVPTQTRAYTLPDFCRRKLHFDVVIFATGVVPVRLALSSVLPLASPSHHSSYRQSTLYPSAAAASTPAPCKTTSRVKVAGPPSAGAPCPGFPTCSSSKGRRPSQGMGL